MASVNNSIVTRKFKGLLGDEVVFRQWEGKTVVAKAPEAREGEPTPAQAQLQERFFVASRYAKSVIKNADKSLAEAYAAVLRPRQNVYSRALEDFMSIPEVKSIDVRKYKGVIGGKIETRAIDDFRVKGVRVEVYAANGTLLEEGDAEQNLNGIDWTYTATQANNLLTGSKIKAIATDVPGNEGILEVTL
jgi:hypothetical protein